VSHRVAGLDVRLEYETGLYRILKPDITVFLHIEESLRQERITERGKGFLDKTLDNESFREKFLKEFELLAEHFYKINVASKNVLEVVQEIRSLISL
jgi:thymidylate kinase